MARNIGNSFSPSKDSMPITDSPRHEMEILVSSQSALHKVGSYSATHNHRGEEGSCVCFSS
jgi:hypothetical protein